MDSAEIMKPYRDMILEFLCGRPDREERLVASAPIVLARARSTLDKLSDAECAGLYLAIVADRLKQWHQVDTPYPQESDK